jgi:hypothetical protein
VAEATPIQWPDRPLHPVQKRFIGAIIASNKGWDAPFPLDFALMDSPSLFASGPTSPATPPSSLRAGAFDRPLRSSRRALMGLPHNP